MKRLTAALVIVAVTAAVTVLAIENGRTMPTTAVIPAPVSQIDGEGTVAVASATGPLSELLGLPAGDDLVLQLGGAQRPGGYLLDVTAAGATLTAADDEGLFNGIQTIRQLLRDGVLPVTRIDDYPRFAYRGVMLDVARHFFDVATVKRYIDDVALLKFNHLHLHLTDDQGWRLEIDGWPELTGIGASTQVGGDGGGFYTKADYAEIVAYAAERFITVVPEIDMPGHTNAAISAYPELGDAPVEPYEGIEVGFSSFAIRSETTYAFIDDVVRQVSELTPGPYLHLGGDESLATSDEDYLYFIERATGIAAKNGKTLIGWHEMGRSPALPEGTIGQYWNFLTPEDDHGAHTLSFVEQGGKVIMSPADVAYLDMQYPDSEALGLKWAKGPTTVREAYEWDPAEIIEGITDEQILGVEGPMWAETLTTIDEIEFMAFPRIAAVAEKAWSPAGGSWAEFEPRLAAFGRVLDELGIRYYRTPEVSWMR
jgi:hexosaminidase